MSLIEIYQSFSMWGVMLTTLFSASGILASLVSIFTLMFVIELILYFFKIM